MFSLGIAAGLLLGYSDVAQRIEVPFRTTQNAMFVDSTINGKPVSCMFDTGFSGAYVINQTINLGKPTGSMTLVDFVRSFEAPMVAVKSLEFGGKKIDSSEMNAVMMDQGSITESYGVHCDGIMGFEVISPYLVEINFEKNKFIFHPRNSLDITKKVPDNKKTFLAKMLPMGRNKIELKVETATGESMSLGLDTGNSFYATTHRDVMERVGLMKPGQNVKFMTQVGVASGAVDAFNVRMKDAKIYGVPVKESIWDIIDLPASSADGDGTVGFQFLKHFNIIIDVAQRRVWLENFSGKVTEEPKGETGAIVFFDPNKKRHRVVFVMPSSPADRAGIKLGDDLLSIDGKEMLNMARREVDGLLEGAPGSVIKLATSRNGQLMRHELTREVLVNDL